MNAIVTPIVPDGDTGYDKFGQLFSWTDDEYGGKTGTIIHDVRGKICPLCGKHWTLSSVGLKDQVYLQSTQQYAHKSCHLRYRTFQDRANLIEQLEHAGLYNTFELAETKNEYFGDRDVPWYTIQLKDRTDRLRYGRRKRVWSMSFELLTKQQQKDLEDAFVLEDCTKGADSSDERGLYYYIHAWSKEKATKYLTIWKELK